MKRLLVIILLLFPLTLLAQNAERIRLSPNYIWGEGSNDTEAINALINKLSATDILPVQSKAAMWKTYRQDLIRASKHISDASGKVLRYIEWDNIDKIFSWRYTKIEELCTQARKEISQNDYDSARTYLSWAEVYLKSVPYSAKYADKVNDLQNKAGKGSQANIKMKNIENDVKNINAALGVKASEKPKSIVKTETKPQVVEEPNRKSIDLDLPKLKMISGKLENEPLDLDINRPAPIVPVAVPEKKLQSGFYVIPRATISNSIGVGIFAGAKFGRIGPWAAYDTDFNNINSSYTCLSDGTSSFGHIWTNGNQKYHRVAVKAGVLYEITPKVTLYGGAGYGSYSCFWQDASENWVKVTDKSSKGISAELGAIYNLSHLSVLAGISGISNGSLALHLGVGIQL